MYDQIKDLNSLVVIAFENGRRVTTFSGLNYTSAMHYIMEQTCGGRSVIVFFEDDYRALDTTIREESHYRDYFKTLEKKRRYSRFVLDKSIKAGVLNDVVGSRYVAETPSGLKITLKQICFEKHLTDRHEGPGEQLLGTTLLPCDTAGLKDALEELIEQVEYPLDGAHTLTEMQVEGFAEIINFTEQKWRDGQRVKDDSELQGRPRPAVWFLVTWDDVMSRLNYALAHPNRKEFEASLRRGERVEYVENGSNKTGVIDSFFEVRGDDRGIARIRDDDDNLRDVVFEAILHRIEGTPTVHKRPEPSIVEQLVVAEDSPIHELSGNQITTEKDIAEGELSYEERELEDIHADEEAAAEADMDLAPTFQDVEDDAPRVFPDNIDEIEPLTEEEKAWNRAAGIQEAAEMQGIALNDNEARVLIALYDNAEHWTGGDFGHIDELSVEGMNEQQLGGYITDLQKKRLMQVHEDNVFTLTEAGRSIVKGERPDFKRAEYTEEDVEDLKKNVQQMADEQGISKGE